MLTSIAFPTLRIWLIIWVPGCRHLFFCVEEWDQVTSSVMAIAGHLGNEVASLKPWKMAVFNRGTGKHLCLYLYKNSTSHYSFSRWGYLIWFDQILGHHSGDFDQKFFWKVKCSIYSRDFQPPSPNPSPTPPQLETVQKRQEIRVISYSQRIRLSISIGFRYKLIICIDWYRLLSIIGWWHWFNSCSHCVVYQSRYRAAPDCITSC